jgi:hypothetical protein
VKRSVLACFAGVLTWVVVASLIDRLLRATLTGYSVAERTEQYTLGMKWARLLMAFVTSLAAGAVTRRVAPAVRWTPWAVGCIALAIFVPLHISIWSRFPAWYHLTFLLSVLPAVLAGARLAGEPRRAQIDVPRAISL